MSRAPNTENLLLPARVFAPGKDECVPVPNRAPWQELAYCSSKTARDLLALRHARRLCCLPLGVSEDDNSSRLLTVVFGMQPSAAALKELSFISGADVVFEIAPYSEVQDAIRAAYGGKREALIERSLAANAEVQTSSDSDALPFPSSDQPVPLLLDAILNRANYLSASDIHLEPQGARTRLRFRIDGRLREDHEFSVSTVVAAHLARRVKVMAELDTTCDSRPQEGAFSFELPNRSLRLRVSIIPQIGGEKIVLRVLEQQPQIVDSGSAPERFMRLGLTASQARSFLAHIGCERGTILLAGPTGSGKSTLLYAALEHLNSEWRNIVTLEDPVERLISGVNQTEVARDSGNTFASMLPALLRQDPDVIMVGEIRDGATAETALTASITGQLVLATVHAGDCPEVFVRLAQLGAARALVASALKLIVAQRLLPLNCPRCLESARMSERVRSLFSIESDRPLYSGRGCDACDFTGVLGRLGVFEMMAINGELREIILSDCTVAEYFSALRAAGASAGYRPLAVGIRELLISGKISPRATLTGLGISPDSFDF